MGNGLIWALEHRCRKNNKSTSRQSFFISNLTYFAALFCADHIIQQIFATTVNVFTKQNEKDILFGYFVALTH